MTEGAIKNKVGDPAWTISFPASYGRPLFHVTRFTGNQAIGEDAKYAVFVVGFL
jgi:hypothetical protein